MNDSTPEKHTFQAEIRQLLDIVVHSLYTDREIFIRELISNASDSMEKLRHLQGTEKDIFDPDLPLEIQITTDESARTITIADHGIGMTHDELVRNLGTIAHSGTKAFLQAIRESGGQAANMIGQFGVGFYSAFMVADRVSVFTHGYRQDAGHLVWISDGSGGYEISEAPGQHRGCRIVIELKEEFVEFANESKVRHWIETYSNFVGFPILLNGTRVNEVEALWLKNKSGITDDEYEAFYKFTAKAFDKPAYRLHFSADAPLAIHALVFLPTENQERWGFGQIDPGVALYCRKVLIDPQPKGLLPDWMRFVKGVIDSDDLPLNISRETMQDSALVRKIGDVISKRVLRMLESEAEADPPKFQEFYRKFERFFKEGVATDHTHREALAKLLRFESSMSEVGKPTSFSEYLTRAKDGQKEIYYLVGSSRDQIESSPTLEAFKARGLEVIYFTDPVDHYVADSLSEFDGKKLVSVDRAGVDLEGDIPTDGEPLSTGETESLCAFLKEVLGERITKVASGKRLVNSPIIALIPEHGMSPQMRRMMKAMNEDYRDEVKVELEINPHHPLVRKLSATRETNRELAELVARQLFDNSLMAAGLLEDSRDTVARMNQLMEKALG